MLKISTRVDFDRHVLSILDRQGDPERPDGKAGVPLRRAGDSGGGDSVIGPAELPHPFGHGDGDFPANAAEVVVLLVGK